MRNCENDEVARVGQGGEAAKNKGPNGRRYESTTRKGGICKDWAAARTEGAL